VSPVGHAANVHLDLACHNFGIQEGREFTQEEKDVFPGCPDLKNGYYYANDKPGWALISTRNWRRSSRSWTIRRSTIAGETCAAGTGQ
jgi:L-alanine-DL-glutamate epimerase-like enolase superfamily enzyme